MRELPAAEKCLPYARFRRAGTLGALAAIAWIVACEDPCVTCPEEMQLPLILSDTAAQAAVPPDLSTSQEAERPSLLATSGTEAATNVAYISLPPGAVPNGVATTIRNRVAQGAITVPMVDGGFDPVAVEATAGDLLDLEIQVGGGSGPLLLTRVVPGRRPPKVVRTNPPPKKRDVALNSTIIIVFSEPLDAETLTDASVQLLLGATAVAGRLEFRDADRLTAAFIPLTPLTAGSDYRLVVTQGIRDRDGEPLEQPVTVEFRTRDAPGPSASVVRVPEDAATIQEGVDFVQAGGVVRVRAGTYAEAVEINKGVTIEAASETDAVVIAPPTGTVAAITVTTTEPVILRRLAIDNPGLAAGYQGNGTKSVYGTGAANITITESSILRANLGVLIENDSALTGARARLTVRNSEIDGGETPAMEGGVFAVSDVDAVIAENTVRRTNFSCIQIQGTANAEVIENDVDMCGPFGGIRAPMDGPESVVNIVGNTVRNSARSESRYGIFLRSATGVIERNTVIDYVQPNTVPGIDAAAIRLIDARATVRLNDISGNSHAGLRNDTPTSVDATCNWWGAADGPSGAGGGSGDAVVGAVSFAPFATAPIAATTETSCSGQSAPATQLAFTVQPTTTVVGRAIAPIVRVSARDALGRPTSGLTGAVTVALAVNPGGAILGGSRTVTAENGVATFLDLSLDRPGSGYVLTASAHGLASANSAAFDVTAQSADVVSFSDFEVDAGVEWSHTRRNTVPNVRYPGRGFLGDFGCTDYQETDAAQADDCRAADVVTLSLAGLPAHGEVTITFDLYLISSWDGNAFAAQAVAPDLFNLSVVGGPTLLNATFAVHPLRPYQSYPAQYPTDGSAPPNNARHTGALAINALGYEMDAVYRLTFTFAHSEPTVAFKFTAPALEDLGNESWGLDNVEVRVGRRP